jgi:hypothetical protein
MVQVGCTNNYGRRCLWKPTEESMSSMIQRIARIESLMGTAAPGCPFERKLDTSLPPRQRTRVDYPGNVGENDAALPLIPNSRPRLFRRAIVGLWRSWERASMAWKRSSVRSRPGPPILSSHFSTASVMVQQLMVSTQLAHEVITGLAPGLRSSLYILER